MWSGTLYQLRRKWWLHWNSPRYEKAWKIQAEQLEKEIPEQYIGNPVDQKKAWQVKPKIAKEAGTSMDKRQNAG